MDEEQSFANLLASSSTTNRPTWSPPSTSDTLDPWANPFASSPSDPFSNPNPPNPPALPSQSSTSYDDYQPTSSFSQAFDEGAKEDSPYVQEIQKDQYENVPQPPSIIAARQQHNGYDQSFGTNGSEEDGFREVPYMSPPVTSPSQIQNDIQHTDGIPPVEFTPKKASRVLPSDLIDEDLMAASDPSLSLKKAFVKSSPRKPPQSNETKKEDAGAYVFKPSVKEDKPTAAVAVVNQEDEARGKRHEVPVQTKSDVKEVEKPKEEEKIKANGGPSSTQMPKSKPSNLAPSSVPLPESAVPTPAISRSVTPQPQQPSTTSPSLPSQTPTHDRVAVSPLDGPAGSGSDFGFKSLAVGASSILQRENSGWGDGGGLPASSSTSSRFAGKGWGSVDDEQDDGLFGKGGPAIRSGKSSWEAEEQRSEKPSWGVEDQEVDGWGGESAPAGPSTPSFKNSSDLPSVHSPTTPKTPATPLYRRKTHPIFTITISDPARVGDPVRGYTVYTIKTRTSSPHYRRSELTALRRFSDFLWLYEALTANNPGIIIPPLPDKHTFGRFQEQFIETRRLALQKSLMKITSHPILQLDPDLRLFLESDNFTVESKNRLPLIRPDTPELSGGSKGLLSWASSGIKFVESDDWFISRSSFLDGLENQLKSLSKSIEVSSKSRLEISNQLSLMSDTFEALSISDLGSGMCNALARLSDLNKREKDINEDLARLEVVNILNLSDEYIRFISSVRLAMGSRSKSWERWQAWDKEGGRLKNNREKLRVQGKLGDKAASTLAEINEVERRARDSHNEFESLTKLVKSEFSRFEKERVDEFKRVLEKYLEEQIGKQKELIDAWEEYHSVVLKMVQKAQGVREGQNQTQRA